MKENDSYLRERNACIHVARSRLVHWRSGHHDVDIYPRDDDHEHQRWRTECGLKDENDHLCGTFKGNRDFNNVTCIMCISHTLRGRFNNDG